MMDTSGSQQNVPLFPYYRNLALSWPMVRSKLPILYPLLHIR